MINYSKSLILFLVIVFVFGFAVIIVSQLKVITLFSPKIEVSSISCNPDIEYHCDADILSIYYTISFVNFSKKDYNANLYNLKDSSIKTYNIPFGITKIKCPIKTDSIVSIDCNASEILGRHVQFIASYRGDSTMDAAILAVFGSALFLIVNIIYDIGNKKYMGRYEMCKLAGMCTDIVYGNDSTLDLTRRLKKITPMLKLSSNNCLDRKKSKELNHLIQDLDENCNNPKKVRSCLSKVFDCIMENI